MNHQQHEAGGLITYSPVETTPAHFLQFWGKRYHYKLEIEKLYEDNIGKDLTPQRLRELFIWKNGGKLSKNKSRSVEKDFVARLEELGECSVDEERKSVLERFGKGGAIWRIYFLHCWNQKRYPIFDQHVYRAMRFIKGVKAAEFPQNDEDFKVGVYLREFVPFVEWFGDIPARMTDRALWAFGKFLKNYPAAFDDSVNTDHRA